MKSLTFEIFLNFGAKNYFIFFLQIIEAEAAVQQVRFTKDKKALVFDVTSDYDDIILEKWFNTKSLEMKVKETALSLQL